MPFWESADDQSRREAHEATRRALERGQIPVPRPPSVGAQRQRGDRFFTSDLTSNEHLLTREAGYEPIGLVMGTAFYKVSFWGYFNSYRTSTGELTSLSQAQLAARELAIARLQQEARLLGAHGVIGVRLQLRGYDWSARTVEFTAIGTAIRIPNRDPDPHPFTSDLSGQEFWQLHQAGYYPKGLVLGICSYYVHTDWDTRNMTRGGFFGMGSSRNQEITQPIRKAFSVPDTWQRSASPLIYISMAVKVLWACTSTWASKILQYELNKTTYHDLLAHFVAVGTAIIHDPQPKAGDRQAPLLYYNLASGKVAAT